MSDHAELFEANRRNWDDRARLHAQGTTGYELDRYRQDRELLSGVVAFDQPHLGDLHGLRVVHLQCHIGTDTLSLARLGADVTGVDQSGVSLDAARELFASVDTAGRFVEANVYDAVAALDGEQFDLVYTGVGAINWLPDIARWGQVVGALVAPGGRFLMRDGHPMGYAIDDEQVEGGVLRLKYPYFETVEPMTFDDTATYVDTGGAELTDTVSHEWNHGIGEVFTALATVGLRVTTLVEHRGLDWEMIPGQVQIGDQWFLPEQHRDAAPLMYTIGATKPAE